jgi:hemerythrin-like metal-binding protein
MEIPAYQVSFGAADIEFLLFGRRLMAMGTPVHDYYEFLQISPNADAETIQRVYRFLAARMHPDNKETGNEENFRLLKAAYDVLSDPFRRTEYDMTRERTQTPPEPLAAAVDFMDVMEGELNRRLAVLAVLYHKRRTNPTYPEVRLSEIEERMGFPRDYLDFTLWYLHKKGYLTKADNAQYALSADGVDFVETQRANIPILNKLLTSGSGSTVEDLVRAQHRETPVAAPEPTVAALKTTFIIPEQRQSAFKRISHMVELTWCDKYAVGIQEIDDEHRELFEAVRGIESAIARNAELAELGVLLKKLVATTGKHFAGEEAIMRGAKYPGLALHAANHQRLMETVEAFAASHGQDGVAVNQPELNFLRDWLLFHIENEDARMGAWLKERKPE